MKRRWYHFDLFGRKVGLTFGRFRVGFHRNRYGFSLSYGLGIVSVL